MTEFGERTRMRIHVSNSAGSILYIWLKLQNTYAFGGSPDLTLSARVIATAER
jgi:hypothetical protein